MRRKSISTSGSCSGLLGRAAKLNRGIRVLAALGAVLVLIAAAAEGQSEGVTPRYQDPNDPGQAGPGQAAPWSVEGKPRTPPSRPNVEDPDRDPLREYMRDLEKRHSGGLRCRIMEVQELGRLYVEDVSGIAGGDPYWLQLPKGVKLLAEDPDSFGGRKKLELEDLEIGQLLRVTLRERDGEIVKVKVRQPIPEV